MAKDRIPLAERSVLRRFPSIVRTFHEVIQVPTPSLVRIVGFEVNTESPSFLLAKCVWIVFDYLSSHWKAEDVGSDSARYLRATCQRFHEPLVQLGFLVLVIVLRGGLLMLLKLHFCCFPVSFSRSPPSPWMWAVARFQNILSLCERPHRPRSESFQLRRDRRA